MRLDVVHVSAPVSSVGVHALERWARPAAARLLPLCESRLELVPEHEGDNPADEEQGNLREIHAVPPCAW